MWNTIPPTPTSQNQAAPFAMMSPLQHANNYAVSKSSSSSTSSTSSLFVSTSSASPPNYRYQHVFTPSPVESPQRAEEKWILSSVLSHHVTGDKDEVYDYRPLNRGSLMYRHFDGESGSERAVKGVGKLEVEFKSGTRATLENVWVVPGARNQVSLQQLISYGRPIWFQPDGKVLYDGHEIAQNINGVYKMAITRVKLYLHHRHRHSLTNYGSSANYAKPDMRLDGSYSYAFNPDNFKLVNNTTMTTTTAPRIADNQSMFDMPPIGYQTPAPYQYQPTDYFTDIQAYNKPSTKLGTAIMHVHGNIGDKPPSPEPTPGPQLAAPQPQVVPPSLTQWHLCLGHIPEPQLKEMVLAKKITTSSPADTRTGCQACTRARDFVTKFAIGDPSVSEVALKSNQPLELIHASLCGPLTVRGVCGVRYFLVIVDDYSRYSFALPVGSPAEVGYRLVDFIDNVERNFALTGKHNRKVMGLKITKACRNKHLLEYARESDVLHLQTVPNKSQMKGVAERTKRALYESALAMCYTANSSVVFWDEAVKHAAAVKNRFNNHRTTASIISPAELFWEGQKDYNGMVDTKTVFGCDVVVKSYPNERGVFVGYSPDFGYYRVYSASQVRLVKSNDIQVLATFNNIQQTAQEYGANNYITPLINRASTEDLML